MQIDSLIPGGHYQFRVRASNRWGVGPPSEPSNMVTLASSSKSHVLLTKKSKCMRMHSRIPKGYKQFTNLKDLKLNLPSAGEGMTHSTPVNISLGSREE